MTEVAKNYNVIFVCSGIDGDRDWRVEFTSDTPEYIENIISACHAYNSGDDCECFIDGEKVVLDGDWGLMK